MRISASVVGVIVCLISNCAPLSLDVVSETFARNYELYSDLINLKLQKFQRSIEGEGNKTSKNRQQLATNQIQISISTSQNPSISTNMIS
jgi:hypothetical protein